jgi:hypothetical protein
MAEWFLLMRCGDRILLNSKTERLRSLSTLIKNTMLSFHLIHLLLLQQSMALKVIFQNNLIKNGLHTSKLLVDLHFCRAAVNESVEAYVARAYKAGTTRASLCFN